MAKKKSTSEVRNEVINDEFINDEILNQEDELNEELLNQEDEDEDDKLVDGLEDEDELDAVTDKIPDFTDINYLRNNSPIFPAEFTSKKFKPKREPFVYVGMQAVKKLMPELSENFVLLCQWWENKAARNELKKLLDAEAQEKGIDPVTYLQHDIREKIKIFQAVREAVDRMAYAATYYIPRNGVKDVFKQYKIRGEVYNVNLRVLNELKAKYGDNREKLFDEIIKVSTKVDAIEEL